MRTLLVTLLVLGCEAPTEIEQLRAGGGGGGGGDDPAQLDTDSGAQAPDSQPARPDAGAADTLPLSPDAQQADTEPAADTQPVYAECSTERSLVIRRCEGYRPPGGRSAMYKDGLLCASCVANDSEGTRVAGCTACWGTSGPATVCEPKAPSVCRSEYGYSTACTEDKAPYLCVSDCSECQFR